jgi:hypothetical protein
MFAKAIQVHDPVTQTAKSFEKDLPVDKSPKAGELHFGHPYPVMQDPSDFDKDFTQDENIDDGSYHAQMEYDRLRNLLTKQRKELQEALDKKQKESEDIAEATEEYEKEINADADVIAEKKNRSCKQDAGALGHH